MKIRFLILMAAVLCLLSVGVATGGTRDGVAASGGSISGVVYFDTDLDGERDHSEPPAPDRTVELLSEEGVLLTTAESGRDGSYRFGNLSPDKYYGVDVANDEETPCVEGGVFYWPGGKTTKDVDIRVAPRGDRSVSGTLLNDLNENGKRDAGELPSAGWQVRLTGFSNERTDSGFDCELRDTVGDDGKFEFTELLKGTWMLSVVAAPPALAEKRVAWELTFATRPFDLPGAYPDMQFPDTSVNLEDSETVKDMELGIYVLSGTGSIDAWIFDDLDRDGIRDEGEPPFDCCGILFLRSSAAGLLILPPPDSRVGVGHYQEVGLPPGDYTIALATWRDNPTGAVDNEGRPVRTITLAEGEAAVVDFGFGVGPQQPESDEEPTPEPPTATPATATPMATTPTPLAIGAPGTGTGDDSRTTSLALPALLAACGVAALSTATVWRRRANSYRGGSR